MLNLPKYGNKIKLVKRIPPQQAKSPKSIEDWTSEDFLNHYKKRMLAQGVKYIPFARDDITVSHLIEEGYNKHQIKLLVDYLSSPACKYPKVKNFYVLSTSYVKFIYKNALKWKMG